MRCSFRPFALLAALVAVASVAPPVEAGPVRNLVQKFRDRVQSRLATPQHLQPVRPAQGVPAPLGSYSGPGGVVPDVMPQACPGGKCKPVVPATDPFAAPAPAPAPDTQAGFTGLGKRFAFAHLRSQAVDAAERDGLTLPDGTVKKLSRAQLRALANQVDDHQMTAGAIGMGAPVGKLGDGSLLRFVWEHREEFIAFILRVMAVFF